MKNKKYFYISKVAEMLDVHPQTLRLYEREGLIQPIRSKGNTRLYDEETLKKLQLILILTRELGVNLAGVDIILQMRNTILELQELTERLLERLKEERAKAVQRKEDTALALRPQTTLARTPSP